VLSFIGVYLLVKGFKSCLVFDKIMTELSGLDHHACLRS